MRKRWALWEVASMAKKHSWTKNVRPEGSGRKHICPVLKWLLCLLLPSHQLYSFYGGKVSLQFFM